MSRMRCDTKLKNVLNVVGSTFSGDHAVTATYLRATPFLMTYQETRTRSLGSGMYFRRRNGFQCNGADRHAVRVTSQENKILVSGPFTR